MNTVNVSFMEVIAALGDGKKVNSERWDRKTTMFVQDGELVQQASGAPYPIQLSWYEIKGKWRIIK